LSFLPPAQLRLLLAQLRHDALRRGLERLLPALQVLDFFSEAPDFRCQPFYCFHQMPTEFGFHREFPPALFF
jgi:hypothetical protein